MRKTCLRFFCVAVGSFFSVAHAAPPLIQTSVNPSRSENGQAVLYKVRIQSDETNLIKGPQLPVLADWDVKDIQSSDFTSSRIANGKIKTVYILEYSYVMKPLRGGTLKIPAFPVVVKGVTYKTEPLEVPVLNFPKDAPVRRSPIPAPGRADVIDPFQTDSIPDDIPSLGGGGASSSKTEPAPQGREEFFVHADLSKTSVYEGELMTLSYFLYERSARLSNPEISKFPDFKGFLKEELLVPKVFSRSPVNLRGERWFKSELLRYAIFPLEPGLKKIQPLSFKATLSIGGINDVIDQMLRGQEPDPSSLGRQVPATKSSPVVEVNVKPLPPAPEGKKFTGGVGKFSFAQEVPSTHVKTDEPFQLKMMLGGRGNFKVIEESAVIRPPEIEQVQSKNSHKYNENAQGEKVFEYLLVARKPGDYEIKIEPFTYFDPELAKYVTLEPEPIKISASGAAQSAPSLSAPAPKATDVFSQRFLEPEFFGVAVLKEPYAFASRFSFILQAALYLFFGACFFWQYKHRERESLLGEQPWLRIESELAEKKLWRKAILAEKLDQWLRLRLVNFLQEKGSNYLDSEALREEFVSALRNLKDRPATEESVAQLKKFWNQLDDLRFTGLRNSAGAAEISHQETLGEAKKIMEMLAKGMIS